MTSAPVYRPRTLEDAVRHRSDHPDGTVLAGGTDVMVMIESGHLVPRTVLDLWACEGLRGIDGGRIGALTTWTDVARSNLPEALRECARTVGAAQIQNRGTVGGNIVNASPAGDSLPLWLALDTEFEVASVRGSRRIPAELFWTAYRKTALDRDELLIAVHVPPVRGTLRYRKVGTRLAQAISKVVFGGRIAVEDGVVTDVRLAFGSVAPIPVRARIAEDALRGRPLAEGLGEAAAAVHTDIAPIDDIRSSAEYRLRVAAGLVTEWLAPS